MKNKPSIIANLRSYPELDKKRKELNDAKEKLEQTRHGLTQKENRLSHLEKEDRKKRNHRLCQKGAHIEYIIPETKEFTDDQFIRFCDALFSFPGIKEHIKKLITKIMEES